MSIFTKIISTTFISIVFIANNVNASEEIPEGKIELDDVPVFIEKARCIACHGMEELRVGPPWMAISAMYSNQNKSKDSIINYMAYKIRYGGAGVWGVTPMIEYERITQDQAKVISEWILNLQK